jgi:hypothetical protein
MACGAHAELASSLAAELGDFDADALERGLAALAAPSGDLASLGAPIRSGALRVREEGDVDDLLRDRVVARGHGHGAAVAVILCELGRRAGLPVGVVTSDRRHFVGHVHVSPWLLDPDTGDLVDARELEAEPAWRCAHEVADTLLALAEQRCERDGDLARALRAATFRCALPFGDDALEQAQLGLLRLRARLN